MFARQGLLFDDIRDEPLKQAKRTENKRRGLGLDRPIWDIYDGSKWRWIAEEVKQFLGVK